AGDHPERDPGAAVVHVGQEELVETRRTRVQDAEAITALLDLEERLDLAVDEELVADEPVEIEGVETEQTARAVVELVAQRERHVELREARQVETRQLVARVELVEREEEPGQPLVDVR